ncbi:CBO0543 family protein [Bacillus sp. FJAT-27245]|uniref:CBO0543 family protein n=1 Tax=Bacillus sp. FJAT-27245 TaxID=1684144 RepID=UPI0006A7D3DB|nr:CBO0543 family protein [Bacillus sp. FJAT-27245]
MNAVYGLLWLAALFKWGDLKNWKKYYSTILFFALGDLLYLYLLSDRYPMWRYTPQGIDLEKGLTSAHISLSIILVKYPATILIYLSKFPKKKGVTQLFYIMCWVLLYSLNELSDIKLNLIKYYNGWNFYWSIFFNAVMFSMLKVHYSRPILAWLLSILFIVLLWNVFDVPKGVFR